MIVPRPRIIIVDDLSLFALLWLGCMMISIWNFGAQFNSITVSNCRNASNIVAEDQNMGVAKKKVARNLWCYVFGYNAIRTHFLLKSSSSSRSSQFAT